MTDPQETTIAAHKMAVEIVRQKDEIIAEQAKRIAELATLIADMISNGKCLSRDGWYSVKIEDAYNASSAIDRLEGFNCPDEAVITPWGAPYSTEFHSACDECGDLGMISEGDWVTDDGQTICPPCRSSLLNQKGRAS